MNLPKKNTHATVMEKKGTFDLKCLENKYTTNLENANPQGEVLNKCLYGSRVRPEVQPVTLLRTIFHENLSEKGTPFVYLLLTNGTPFPYLV